MAEERNQNTAAVEQDLSEILQVRRDKLALLLVRAAIPLSSGLRRAANPHRPMDGYRFRCCTGAP